jgi:hypothetical protein
MPIMVTHPEQTYQNFQTRQVIETLKKYQQHGRYDYFHRKNHNMHKLITGTGNVVIN